MRRGVGHIQMHLDMVLGIEIAILINGETSHIQMTLTTILGIEIAILINGETGHIQMNLTIYKGIEIAIIVNIVPILVVTVDLKIEAQMDGVETHTGLKRVMGVTELGISEFFVGKMPTITAALIIQIIIIMPEVLVVEIIGETTEVEISTIRTHMVNGMSITWKPTYSGILLVMVVVIITIWMEIPPILIIIMLRI